MWNWVSRYQNVSILDFIGAKSDGSGGDNCSCKTCTAPVKMSPPTNRHPVFFTDRMPFLSPNQQCESTEREKSGVISGKWKLLIVTYEVSNFLMDITPASVVTCFCVFSGIAPLLMCPSHWYASGCVVEWRICSREVAGSNLGRGYFAPGMLTRPGVSRPKA